MKRELIQGIAPGADDQIGDQYLIDDEGEAVVLRGLGEQVFVTVGGDGPRVTDALRVIQANGLGQKTCVTCSLSSPDHDMDGNPGRLCSHWGQVVPLDGFCHEHPENS